MASSGGATPAFLGLISGTSVDGVDAAIVSFDPVPRLHFARTYPLPPDVVADVLRLSQADARITLDEAGRLDTRLGQAFAAVARQALAEAGEIAARVQAIG